MVHVQPTAGAVLATEQPRLMGSHRVAIARRTGRWPGRRAALLVAVCGTLAPAALGQQVDAFWSAATSGNWLDGTKWSTNPWAPNNDNQPGVSYRAFIQAMGSAYTITLADDVALDALTLDSAQATVNHTAKVLTVPTLDLFAGAYRLNGGTLRDTTINLLGGSFVPTWHTGNILDNVTLNGSLTPGFSYFTAQNGLTVNGTMDLNGNATLGFIGGPQTVDAGTFIGGRLSVGGGSSVTFGPATEVHAGTGITTIGYKTENEAEGDNEFINQGLVTASGAERYLNIMPNLFTNEGTVEVRNGAVVAAGVAQYGLETQWTNNGLLRVENGTLSLGGRFSFGPQGSIERTGGKISLAGVWESGGVLNVDATTGSIHMDGGAIEGGEVNLLDGHGLIFDTGAFTGAGTGGLYGVTLNGDLELGDKDATLGIRDGLTLNGTILLTGESARINLLGDLTIPTGAFVFDATDFDSSSMGSQQDSHVTLGPGVVVRGGRGGFGGLQGSTFINQGLVSADVAGQSLGVSGWVFENEGIIEARNGAKLNISANEQFNNSGLIRVFEGSTLTIGNNFRQTGGTIEQTGGLIVVTGDIDNTGLSMNLTQPTDIWVFDSGSLTGGVLNITSDASLTTKGASAGSLDGVAVNGELVLDDPQGAGVNFRDGLVLNGSVTMVGNRTVLSSSTQTFSGDGELVMRGIDDNGGNVKQELILKPGQTLTIAPDFTIRGGALSNKVWLGRASGGGAHLVNQGLISSELPGQGITIKALEFTNEGVLEAKDGGIVEITEAYWTSTGIIRAVNGGRMVLGGVYSTPSLDGLDATTGSIELRGDLDNTGSTLVIDDQLGTLTLSDGRIRGGTIDVQPGGQFLASGGGSLLDGVALNGDLMLGDGGNVLVSNSLALTGVARLTGESSYLRFNGDQTFGGSIYFEGQTGEQAIMGVNNSTVTLDPSAYVRGGRGTIYTADFSSVVNQGLISADVADQAITIYLNRFNNEGTLEAINGGSLIMIPPDSPDPMLLENSGLLAVGVKSRLAFEGEFVQTDQGMLSVAIGGDWETGRFGRVWLSGVEDIDGALRITLADGYQPSRGDVWTLLRWGELTGSFSTFELPALDAGLQWNLSRLYTHGSVRVGIPAPAASAVGAVALMTLGRRRRAAGGSGVRP